MSSRFLPEALHHFGLYHIPNMAGWPPRMIDDMGRLVTIPPQWYWTTGREGMECVSQYMIVVDACNAGL